MYLVKKGRDYTTPPGSKKSYTRSFLRARRYRTKEEAQADCCGNECIVNEYQEMKSYST